MKNGFRERLRLFKFTPFNIQLGLRFFIVCFSVVTFNWVMFVLALFVPMYVPVANTLGIKIKLNKENLSGDNLKLFETLEQRFESLPDSITKEDVQLEVRRITDQFKDIDFAKIKELVSEDDKGIRSILLKQGEEIAKLKENGGGKPVQPTTVRGFVAEWMEQNKKEIEAIRSGGRNVSLPPLVIRAPITMTVGASLGSSAYTSRLEVEPGINDLNRTQPTFWQRLKKGATKAATYVWVNKVNKQGNAEFIGEGELKPLASFELSPETSIPKKVAERMKASTELLYDVDGMASFIEDELRFEVETAANTASLTGNGTGENPKGVTHADYSTTYTQTGIETTEPNNLDAIRAAVAQLRLLNYTNLTVWINPVDAANMDMAKGDDGHYLLPPFTTSDGKSISGITIQEDANIAEGYLLVGDFNKYFIKMYQPFHVSWGWENDDFSKNLITVIGEMRFHQFVKTHDTTAFLYDTFANIKTAIAAA